MAGHRLQTGEGRETAGTWGTGWWGEEENGAGGDLDKRWMMVESLVQGEGAVGWRSPRWHVGGGGIAPWEIYFIGGI